MTDYQAPVDSMPHNESRTPPLPRMPPPSFSPQLDLVDILREISGTLKRLERYVEKIAALQR